MSEIIKKLKDPGSAITHFIGMLMAIMASFPLIIKAVSTRNTVCEISCMIFIVSMILLYGASATYHTFDINPIINKFLKKMDHAMIFILIAGSYTPVCLLVLKNNGGLLLLTVIWSIALLGIVFKLCWVTCPQWVSSIMYIAMGWMCVFTMKPLFHNLSGDAFFWLVIGGIIYTIGGVIYALKLPAFNARHKNFGTHEIFHLFVMAGSICHFIFVYGYLA
jgi:hemolysin III